MSTRLEGKRALVTGASSGIGREVAVRFAAEGAKVACGGRDEERTNATVERITAAGGTAVAVVGDVSEPESAEQVVEAAAAALGGLDSVVNNAGIDATEWKPVADWPVDEFDLLIRTNLRGPFLVAKYAIPHLLEAGGGSIVHMSSVCAITVWAGDCGYDISKAGLNMLSDHISVEYGAAGDPLQHAHAGRDRHRAARVGDGRRWTTAARSSASCCPATPSAGSATSPRSPMRASSCARPRPGS